jgi:hypothetical protein
LVTPQGWISPTIPPTKAASPIVNIATGTTVPNRDRRESAHVRWSASVMSPSMDLAALNPKLNRSQHRQ